MAVAAIGSALAGLEGIRSQIGTLGGILGDDTPTASVETEFRGTPCPGSPPFEEVQRMVRNAPERVKVRLLDLFNRGNAWQYSASIEAAGLSEFTKSAMGGRDCHTGSDIGKTFKREFLAAVDQYGRVEAPAIADGAPSPWLDSLPGMGGGSNIGASAPRGEVGPVVWVLIAFVLIAVIGFGLWKSAS